MLQENITVFEICRLNFANATGLHLETSIPYKPSEGSNYPTMYAVKLLNQKNSKSKYGPRHYYDSKIGVTLDSNFDTIDESKKESMTKWKRPK